MSALARRVSVWVILGSVVLTGAAPRAGSAQGLAVSDVVGVWNVETESLADRPTRGVRNVILILSEEDGDIEASITNLRNDFVPVSEVRYDAGSRRIQVWYGAYHYNLRVTGEQLEGVVVSPVGEMVARGARQASGDFRYRGLSAEPFEATRTGIVGHIEALDPPPGEPNPGRWVLDRITSPDEWALIVGRGRLGIGFSNAPDFETELRTHAGEEVDLRGVWVGERMRILEIAMPGGEAHAH